MLTLTVYVRTVCPCALLEGELGSVSSDPSILNLDTRRNVSVQPHALAALPVGNWSKALRLSVARVLRLITKTSFRRTDFQKRHSTEIQFSVIVNDKKICEEKLCYCRKIIYRQTVDLLTKFTLNLSQCNKFYRLCNILLMYAVTASG
jgi:hypothetical protein